MVPAFTVGEMVGKDSLDCDVYEGKSHVTSGDNVALKFIPNNAMLLENIKKRLDIELACLTKLKHTNIQNLLEVIENPQHVVRVYDYDSSLTGGNIRQYFLQERNGFALDWEQTQAVMLQLISAVTHLHTNDIIHKDITLDNIGLVVKGSLHHVKLTSFYVCEILQAPDQDLVLDRLTAGIGHHRTYECTNPIYSYASHLPLVKGSVTSRFLTVYPYPSTAIVNHSIYIRNRHIVLSTTRGIPSIGQGKGERSRHARQRSTDGHMGPGSHLLRPALWSTAFQVVTDDFAWLTHFVDLTNTSY